MNVEGNGECYKPNDMREWVRTVTGVYDYINKLATWRDTENDLWAANQIASYRERLNTLLAHSPEIPSKWMWRKMLEVYHARNIRRAKSKSDRKAVQRIHTGTAKSRAERKQHSKAI